MDRQCPYCHIKLVHKETTKFVERFAPGVEPYDSLYHPDRNGCKLSAHQFTIEMYQRYLEEAPLINFLERWSNSIHEQM